MHGILVPGGFGSRGAEGKILAARFARERKVPYFGICFGMQMAVIEACRSLAGLPEANSTEFGPTPEPVVGLMTEWLRGNELEQRRAEGDLGGTMRLGAYPAALKPGSRIAEIYGETRISERHRHRYEVNTAYRARLEEKGMVFAGMSPDGLLPETIEFADHPWFIGVQYHPELKSRPVRAAPAVRELHRRGQGAEPAGVRPEHCGRRRGRVRIVRSESADEGRVAEWFKAAVLKTAVGASPPWVRIPPLPPIQNRTANAGRSRFYARGGGERSEQIALRSHDADFAVRDLDPLGQRAKVFAAIAAAVDPDALAGGRGELLDHGGRDRLLPRAFQPSPGRGRRRPGPDRGSPSGRRCAPSSAGSSRSATPVSMAS